MVGRRGGKSFILATFRTWRPYLQPGERGAVMVIAADRKQAHMILRYIRGRIALYLQ